MKPLTALIPLLSGCFLGPPCALSYGSEETSPLDFCHTLRSTEADTGIGDVRQAPSEAFETSLIVRSAAEGCSMGWSISATPMDSCAESDFMEHHPGELFSLEWSLDESTIDISNPDCGDTFVGGLVNPEYTFDEPFTEEAEQLTLDLKYYAGAMQFVVAFGYGYAEFATHDDLSYTTELDWYDDSASGTWLGVSDDAESGCQIKLPD